MKMIQLVELDHLLSHSNITPHCLSINLSLRSTNWIIFLVTPTSHPTVSLKEDDLVGGSERQVDKEIVGCDVRVTKEDDLVGRSERQVDKEIVGCDVGVTKGTTI
jgi:hypothetical protein